MRGSELSNIYSKGDQQSWQGPQPLKTGVPYSSSFPVPVATFLGTD
jgi:hypothetical protein